MRVPDLTDDAFMPWLRLIIGGRLISGTAGNRTSLYTRGPENDVLLLNVHHIAVIHAWSVLLVDDKLLKLYVEANGGAPAGIPRAEPRYSDYATWQERVLSGTEGDRLWNYWRDKLAAPRRTTDLPRGLPPACGRNIS